MHEDDPMADRAHQLTEIAIGDAPADWAAAGFAVGDDTVVIASTAIRLVGEAGGRGIRSISIDGLAGDDLDGIPLTDSAGPPSRGPVHPNGVDSIDHLVVLSPDVDRTTSGYEERGLEARRERRFEVGGVMRRQTFFWLGDVILELVGEDDAHGDGPSLAWGLAVNCPDLDASVAALGDRCGPAKNAVQKGRRIATMRTRDLGISVPIALMSPHPG